MKSHLGKMSQAIKYTLLRDIIEVTVTLVAPITNVADGLDK